MIHEVFQAEYAHKENGLKFSMLYKEDPEPAGSRLAEIYRKNFFVWKKSNMERVGVHGEFGNPIGTAINLSDHELVGAILAARKTRKESTSFDLGSAAVLTDLQLNNTKELKDSSNLEIYPGQNWYQIRSISHHKSAHFFE